MNYSKRSSFHIVRLLFLGLLLPLYSSVFADTVTESRSVTSPDSRVAVLELYTSEGCSSCPPADRFMSSLKSAGISDKQLIPMAFHVTYWDYIGWQDRFANRAYDERQRELARESARKSVYTPQFVLSGEDYRRYASFSEDISELSSQQASLKLTLRADLQTADDGGQKISLELKSERQSDASQDEGRSIALYFVVLENNLVSDVSDGENDGKKLHHDYVVRKLSGPYMQRTSEQPRIIEHDIRLSPEWKRDDLSVVAFAEDASTGKVLQAVQIKY